MSNRLDSTGHWSITLPCIIMDVFKINCDEYDDDDDDSMIAYCSHSRISK